MKANFLSKSASVAVVCPNIFAEIAFQTGFSSPSYFSKCFKKEFGLSPSVFKEKLA
ncbi:MAG: AraC family transcriptional regulator [Lewinella sp.]|nr:AraC family transcriptional regulator [Lewinella sp.]